MPLYKFLPIVFILSVIGLNAQNSTKPRVVYSYDNSGNRIQRSLVLPIIKKDPLVNLTPPSHDSIMVLDRVSENNTKSTDVTSVYLGKQSVSIYPNPTMGRLTVGLKDFDGVSNTSIEILDPQGKVIYSTTQKQRVYSFDLTDQPAGYYYLNLVVDGVVGSYTVIKQ